MGQPLKIRLFDIESNGLLPYSCNAANGMEPVTHMHCLVVHDVHAGWYRRYSFANHGPNWVQMALECLREADILVAHNGIKYDIPVLEYLHGFSFPKERVIDTLVLSRLLYADLKDRDIPMIRRGTLPGRLMGSHSLEAWGYRTGVMKDEYTGDPTIEDIEERKRLKWSEWNITMEDYCEQDVRATLAIFLKFTSDAHYFNDTEEEQVDDFFSKVFAVRLEHKAAWTLAQMERNGFPFNERGAAELYSELAAKRQELLQKVIETFGSWYRPKGGTEMFRHPVSGKPLSKYPMVKYPKTGSLYLKDGKTLSKTPYYQGAPYTPVEWVQFNPGSRDHIAKVLMDRGWEPTEFTDTGKPSIDEEVLGNIRVADPEAQAAISLVAEYMLVGKRIGQIAEGDNAWLRLCKNGFIHGSVNPNGAVTGRATHAYPNIAQVPSGTAPYGPQCRSLFGAAYARHLWPQAVQVGTDASGLELRCLGHFMAKYDDGAYIDALLNGDIHWTNVLALGLVPQGTPRDKHSEEHNAARAKAKTFIYAFLYGAGDLKLGQDVMGQGKEAGKELKKSFMEKTPAIAYLKEAIEFQLVESSRWVAGEQQVKWKRKWLKGLDGRRLNVRSPHSALNTLLQSAGALACKYWVVRTEELLIEWGYKHGWDGDFAYAAWVHDEMQIICRTPEIAEAVKKASAEAMREAGEFFKFRCPLATDAMVGDTWNDCH